ncbi:MAG: DUF4129 domain-containing protein, partial [Candidatus Dormibacteraeota bacterium]|nr:DUF4129 domain-containing protein [Candidatus Dormibacteraeota bacterium]
VGLAGLGYLALAALLPPWRRRRRRWRASAQARVLGAWQEAVDQLRHLGLPPVTTLSAHDVARFGASAMGEVAAGHLVPLARAVNQARFAGQPADDAVASSAWFHSDALRRLVAEATPMLRRLRRRLDPRSLWGSST